MNQTPTPKNSPLGRIFRLGFLILAIAHTPSGWSAPPTHTTWTLISSKSDEFNSFDSTKWDTAESMWYSTTGVFAFKNANATVSGGNAVITAKKENYNGKAYTAGGLKSKFTVGGGNGASGTYTEIRAKLLNSAANVCSALWLGDQPVQANNPNVELDIQELLDAAGKPNLMTSTMHRWPINPNSHDAWPAGFFVATANLTSDYHVYGLERRDGRVRIYLDGVLIRDFNTSVCPELATQPRKVILNLEGHSGNPVDGFLPASLQVDYVRVYQAGSSTTPPLANSAQGFSGTQGQNGWYYGYANLSSTAAYIPGSHYQAMTWTSGDQTWYGPGGTFHHIKEPSVHPAGEWTIRRWQSSVSGTVNLSGIVSRYDPNGDGVRFRVYVGGTEVQNTYVNAGTSLSFNISGQSVSVGTTIDFCINQGSANNWYDTTEFLAAITSGSTQPVPNGTYKIVARHSGLVLDVFNHQTANGSIVDQWTYNGGNNMRWTITHLGNNQYKIIGVESGRALAIGASSQANGAQAIIWDYLGINDQKWTITPTSGGYYSVVAVHSGKALDVNAFAMGNGGKVQQWTVNGEYNQQWAFQAP